MSNQELNFKQERFLEEYLKDPTRNGKAAAIRVGYSVKTAAQIASRLLKHPKIAPIIEKDKKELAKSFGISKERILQELCKLGFANIQDFAAVTEDGESIRTIPKDMAAAISEWTVETVDGKVAITKKKVKLADKRGALMDMAKMLGYVSEKVEVSGNVTLQQLVEESMINDNIIEGEIVETPLLETAEDV